ncbi:hypothetical protein CDAR_82731 [Caerostris darwini]|uniref:Uncharacterized protein n=1 Tax=Caerostris darwini TaxID=1538125 RepID=A0AAV4U853_9ARAC|nr:hypothetical protein CDAR_82731 [Caerostris darwini]
MAVEGCHGDMEAFSQADCQAFPNYSSLFQEEGKATLRLWEEIGKGFIYDTMNHRCAEVHWEILRPKSLFLHQNFA